MRSPGTVAAIPALGLAAALAAHEALLGIATLRLGAPSYAAHAHSSVGPALVIELTLVVAAGCDRDSRSVTRRAGRL